MNEFDLKYVYFATFAGETFARNMLFLFVSSLLQAFSVSIPAGEAVYSFEDNLTGMIRTTQDHWIQMKAR